MIDETCRQAADWSAQAGRAVRVSINIDTEVLGGRQLVTTMEQAMTSAGLVAGQLLLEIEQGELEQVSGEAKANLERLARIGVGLVVDNARAATRIPRLSTPLVGIKINHDWLPTVGHATSSHLDSEELDLTDGVLVVATGVERAEELERVRSLGVPAAQGFWLQRPAAAGQLTPLVEGGADRDQSLGVVGGSADAAL